MPNADKNHLNIPHKQAAQNLKLTDDQLDAALLRIFQDQDFDNWKAIERWAADVEFDSTMFPTFQHIGGLTLTESDIYWVTTTMDVATFEGGVTTYGSGTVTVTLNKNGSAVGDALTITSSGLFSADINETFIRGDAMTAEITGAGTGCIGLVTQPVA